MENGESILIITKFYRHLNRHVSHYTLNNYIICPGSPAVNDPFNDHSHLQSYCPS